MKGILQYCSTVDGTYKNAGTVRSAKNKDYRVKPITIKDRLDHPEPAAYKVYVRALCLTLNTDFLDETEWYFRIAYFDEDDMKRVSLGEHAYTIDYNGLLQVHYREYHTIELEFTIDYDEYEDYAVPVALPESEGGIILEDDDIYIE